MPAERVEEELELLLDRANVAVSDRIPNTLFEFKLAQIYADFVDIHPLIDGNGKTAILVIEALAAQKGMGVHTSFDADYDRRLEAAFRGNKLAYYYSKIAAYYKFGHSYEKELPDEEE